MNRRPPSAAREPPSAALSRQLSRRGLRSTRQREIIAKTFLSGRRHAGVDEVLARARLRDGHISPATVYRTMKLLVACGLATPHQFGDGHTRYEPAAGRQHHDHLICGRCGAIVEFEEPRIEALQRDVARRHGFRVTDHRLELHGLCRRCRRARRGTTPAAGAAR